MKKLYLFLFFISTSCFFSGALQGYMSAITEGKNIWLGTSKPIQQPIPRLELNVPNTEPDFSQFKSELPNTSRLNNSYTLMYVESKI